MIEYVLNLVKSLSDPQTLIVLMDTVFTGWWIYGAASLVVWFENAILVGFIFPGDSLVFALGVLAAGGRLDIMWLTTLLTTASAVGGTVGYFLGYQTGTRIFNKPDSRWFKQEYVRRTQFFFEQYGGITITIARFMPVIRSFAPFMAGVGRMSFKTFMFYNILGAVLWACGLSLLGYYLGNLPWIQDNFAKAILLIITVSFMPVIIEYFLHKKRKSKQTKKIKNSR